MPISFCIVTLPSLKKTVSILLICALSFQFMIKIGLVGYYIINKDYIAKVLCINKDKPALKCQGKCHLKKQLAKTETAENQRRIPSSSVKDIIETLIFCENQNYLQGLIFHYLKQAPLFAYSFSCILGPLDSPFHPPCA